MASPLSPGGDGGVTGALVRGLDWSSTPLGAIATWPRSLTTIVETLLGSRHPMFLFWGPELVQIYNDAYLPSFGVGKHPVAMGQRGADCWGEIWPIIGPQIADVMAREVPSWHEDALVPIFRNGRIEEVFWTYGYSPVFQEDGTVGGTLVVCTETTARVLQGRRQRLFRVLAERTAAVVEAELIDAALSSFTRDPEDVPFALVICPLGISSTHAVGVLDGDAEAVRARVQRALPLAGPAVVTLDAPVVAGPWPEPVTHVLAIAMGSHGVLVFGLSARLAFDDAYRTLLVQIVETLAQARARIVAHASRLAAEAERRDLLLQAPLATALLTGPEHRFELANARYEEMVGRKVVGKTYAEAFPELVSSPLIGILDGVYHRGEPFVTQELLVPLDRARRGTPEPCYFRFNLQPIRDAYGAVYGMMATAVEITDIVHARDEQARAHAQLQAAHDERTELVGELESASRAKDEFLAMLGHELRNPLAPIVTALDILESRDAETLSREHELIRRQVAHLTRLVDDLLDVSKITRGKVDLRRESVPVADIVTAAIEIADYVLDERTQHLTVDVPADGLQVWGDRVRLAQIIANLLTNAARYTPPGGDIRVSARREVDTVVIEVVDNGIGIAAELLPHVFDLFVQGHRSADRAQGGLGIGLTLVKNLLALHGGTVSVTSAGPGQGSRFAVRLPTTGQPAAIAPPREPTGPVPRTTGKRVLLVDDNIDAAEMLGELLRGRGFDVALAHDGPHALELVPAFRPEIAILDIGLPVMDGYELAARLAETPGGEACRLVAVTGYGQDSDRARAKAAGFAAHLVKPVGFTALLNALG